MAASSSASNLQGGSRTGSEDSSHADTPSMKPSLTQPRALTKTQYTVAPDANGVLTYDSPREMGGYLCATQGAANEQFQGTCGLCSCANILRLSGVDVGEKEMIDYASSSGYCSQGGLPELNGGTSAFDRQSILGHSGIESELFRVETGEDGIATENSLLHIANEIEEGKGVILAVYASELDPHSYVGNGTHAVTATSFTLDGQGRVTGFYIADSNFGTKWYEFSHIRTALVGESYVNITKKPIR